MMAWVQASIFNMGFEWILKEEGGKCVPKPQLLEILKIKLCLKN
jgi:hypothetical protein